jgi:hypothetical protein
MALLAAYSFDEASGDVLDYSGNSRNWTLNTGAQRTASGHTASGLTKIGAGLATVANPAFGQTTARTFMFWLQGAGNGVWVARWYIVGDDTGSWGLYILGGNVNLRVRKGGSNTNITVAFPADGLWHHYAGTYDGTNSRLYLDGTLVATSGTVTAPLDTADRIDLLETSLTTQTMDDLRIYDQALDQATIATLMATPVTASATDVTGTATGAGGGSGAAAGVREVVGSASGGGVGTGSATGSVEVPGTASGQGGGVGSASGVREVTAAASGAGGGVGSAVGTVESIEVIATAVGLGGGVGAAAGVRELVGVGAGVGGGVGAAAGVREVVGVAVGAGGGVGAAVVATDVDTPPERVFVVAAESRVFTVPAESRTWEA